MAHRDSTVTFTFTFVGNFNMGGCYETLDNTMKAPCASLAAHAPPPPPLPPAAV